MEKLLLGALWLVKKDLDSSSFHDDVQPFGDMLLLLLEDILEAFDMTLLDLLLLLDM